MMFGHRQVAIFEQKFEIDNTGSHKILLLILRFIFCPNLENHNIDCWHNVIYQTLSIYFRG